MNPQAPEAAGPLVVIETHPVQYHAPVYRYLHEHCGIPVHVVYGSDFSVAGYHDAEFGASFAWDSRVVRESDACTFLSRVSDGGATSYAEVSASGLWGVLRGLRPRAVLMTGYRQRFHAQALLHALRLGCPLLYRAETTDHAVERGRFKAILRDLMLRALYSRYDALLAIGERSRAHYRRLRCEPRRLYLSPYCVDTASFHPSESDRASLRDDYRAKLRLNPDDFAVLFSGKLSRRKGPHILVEALGQLEPQLRRRTRVVFVGDGHERDALEAEARRVGVVALFLGFKNQSELSAFYHSADLLVLPSLESETWGLVVNEALLHGVQAVVSDRVGCAPDLIKDGVTGSVVPAGSPEALACAVTAAAARRSCCESREACRRHVSNYSVTRAAVGIAEALRGVEANRYADVMGQRQRRANTASG